jgi:hypothetical protein
MSLSTKASDTTTAIMPHRTAIKTKTPQANIQSITKRSRAKIPPERHFCNLPPELMFVLLEYLDDTTATCLSITCKKLYAIYKTYHKEFVRFDYYTVLRYITTRRTQIIRKMPLFKLLRKWVGKSYTYNNKVPLFLNVDIYGYDEDRIDSPFDESRGLEGSWCSDMIFTKPQKKDSQESYYTAHLTKRIESGGIWFGKF